MSRITMQNFKEPYVVLLREGTDSDPYVDITETIKIVPRIEESSLAPTKKPIAILREIPVDTYGVSAIVQGTPNIELIEIRDSLSEPDATHFKVDYTNGRVYLSDDYEMGTINFTYKGRGIICVTAQRVIVDTGGDANDVSTLADIINMQLSELSVGNLNDLLTTDKDCAVDAINEVYTNAINILSDLNAHKIDYLNPHQTTKEQVELGNVDNTSDVNKPVSTAQKTYIDDADGILQDQIDALRGSFIYIGFINLNTANVTQELLSARALEIMGGTTVKLGWVLVDNEKHEWYYNADITTWIDFEQPNVYQASNSIYGIVKGDGTDVSIASGIITVNNAGNASNLGGVAAINYATKEYVDANGGIVILLAVTDTAPTTCSVGDVYFNTATKLLYDCEVINTWETGYTPNELKIYIDGSTNISYYYNGDTLVMTGATEVINSLETSSTIMAPSVDVVVDEFNKRVLYFDSVAAIVTNASSLKDGNLVETKGYYEPEDGGNSKYIVIESDLSTSVDGGSVIELVANSKYLKLIQTDYINIKQFGAKGDGTTDDTVAIQNAIDYATNIEISSGIFLCGEININEDNKTIYGKGELKQNTSTLLNIYGENIIIKDVTINGNGKTYSIFSRNTSINTLIENIHFKGNIGHYLLIQSNYTTIKDCFFEGHIYSCVTPIVFHNCSYCNCLNNYFDNVRGFNIQTRLGANNINIKNNHFNNIIYSDSIIATAGQTTFAFICDKYSRKSYKVNNTFNNIGTITETTNGYTITFSSGLVAGDLVTIYGCNSLENININSNSYYINIDGNMINGTGDSGIVLCADYHDNVLDPSNVDEDDYPQNIIISNNTIKNCFYSCIAETHKVSNVSIINNILHSCAIGLNTSISTYNGCMYIIGNAISISNNIIERKSTDIQTYGIIIRPLFELSEKNGISISNNSYIGNFIHKKWALASEQTTTNFRGVNDEETIKEEYPIFVLDSSWSGKPVNTEYMTYGIVGGTGVINDTTNGIISGLSSIKTVAGEYIQGTPTSYPKIRDSILTIEFDALNLAEGTGGYFQIYHRLTNQSIYTSNGITITSTTPKRYKIQIITGNLSSLILRIGAGSSAVQTTFQNIKCYIQKI